jgi:hypothetical protein
VEFRLAKSDVFFYIVCKECSSYASLNLFYAFKGTHDCFIYLALHNKISCNLRRINSYKPINPFKSNFSANRKLPSSYLFWAVKRLMDYLQLSYSFKREKHGETEKVQPALSVG